MKSVILAAAVATVIGGFSMSGSAIAAKGGDTVLSDDLSRRGPGTTSGSGDTVEANCPTDPSGYDWQGSTGKWNGQSG